MTLVQALIRRVRPVPRHHRHGRCDVVMAHPRIGHGGHLGLAVCVVRHAVTSEVPRMSHIRGVAADLRMVT